MWIFPSAENSGEATSLGFTLAERFGPSLGDIGEMKEVTKDLEVKLIGIDFPIVLEASVFCKYHNLTVSMPQYRVI